MDQNTIIMIGFGIAVVVGVLFMLRRSWGNFSDQIHTPVDTSFNPMRRPIVLSDQDLADVQALLDRKKKIEAIKRVRELTGVGLKEAKDYVETLPYTLREIRQEQPVTETPDALPPEYLEEVRALVARRKKIEAIKRVRELTGVGLKEAKDFVDALERQG